ncbi:MAG: molybdate ABC transporter permease subunit [Bacillota bacterium]|nr:molybdate ABC transporter permease subunit [Bacillota bacterium]
METSKAKAGTVLHPQTSYSLEKNINISLLALTVIIFLILIVMPLGELFAFSAKEGIGIFLDRISQPATLHSLGLTFKIALATSIVNLVVGTAMAFVLVRTSIPGKRILDAIVDIPLAIPTVVIGFALLLLYSPNGILGKYLTDSGIKLMFSFPGILLAHIFVTFPFMVRQVGTVLEGLDRNYENAAKTLGASSWQTFFYVTLPALKSGLIAGSVLTFAKSLGEFGATMMVSGNLMFKTRTGPLQIYSLFNTGDLEGASAVAIVLAIISFIVLFALKIATTEKKEVAKVE